mmetsp:Transcript_92718/g.202975  ORF Transcript_92718/g.202975 Transcript_92718/m.202975 type:complete len:1080 (+) Transcript_92718:95-3334(+)
MSVEEESVDDRLSSDHSRSHDSKAQDDGSHEEEESPALESEAIQSEESLIDAGIHTAHEVNSTVFEELHLPDDAVHQAQEAWKFLVEAVGSREATGEAIYAALFDAAPSIQPLFKTPRAVMALRFMTGINQIIADLGSPTALKVVVETLGFQHLDLEVTEARTAIFREAILELVKTELTGRCSPLARESLAIVLNYVGGSFIYIRAKFAEKLKVIQASWSTVNQEPESAADGGSGTEEQSASFSGKDKEKEGASKKLVMNASVPHTFTDMFQFNAAVMGFGNCGWMGEILASFDTIVTHVANSYRLQEECDVLSLRLAKFKTINLGEYKAVMLASLRSLCKEWGSDHEVAWSWLWENVERLLQGLMGKPGIQEKALTELLNSLDEAALQMIRREVYSVFFASAPAGQEYFKQSTTRLHFIADKVVSMTLDMYREPKKMVEDISALGLRHVGYGIPTDLFGPFVSACVAVVHSLAPPQQALEAFRWSLNLVTRILTRVIMEGSTVAMQAINANSARQLRRAVSCAPRGERALWVLNVQVGTQSISPLLWALEAGSLDAASAIIQDLLTIRADRDRYYFGADPLFERHPDIIKRLVSDGPAILPLLLDGLIWRSRTTQGGQRRVVYYVKHLLADLDGNFSPNLQWLYESGNPKLVCHPLVVVVADMVWSGVAFRSFTLGRLWFLITLLVFIVAQCAFNTHEEPPKEHSEGLRVGIFALRVFIYVLSMGSMLAQRTINLVTDIRSRKFTRYGKLVLPDSFTEVHSVVTWLLCIMLVVMLALEPIVYCMQDDDSPLFAEHCSAAEGHANLYGLAAALALFLYFMLLGDLAVYSTKISAYALVCTRAIAEMMLCLVGLSFVVLTFTCAICALKQDHPDFNTLPNAALSLVLIPLSMLSGERLDSVQAEDSTLLMAVMVYMVVSGVFLLTLLVSQLNCAYAQTYEDMLGFARLHRIQVVCDTMVNVPPARWSKWITGLALDERVEFGEGDIGLSGGVQVLEPSYAHITTVDIIKRFGGSTSPAEQWPEDVDVDDEDDRAERFERSFAKSMKKFATFITGVSTGSISSGTSGSTLPGGLDKSSGSD